MWCIYKHTNPINNKSYIGQTSRDDPSIRWQNGLGYQDSRKFWQAILKYGWDIFTHEIIENDIPTLEKADEREVYWINYYDSVNNGYNISLGGGRHLRGPEYGKRISEGQKKNWDNNPERHEKARQKLLEQWQDENYRNKFLGSNNGNAKQIICLDNGMIFDTLKDAAEWAKTSRQNITGVLRKRQKTAAGYHWDYYKEKEENI